jgi:hypothetical protein
MLAGTIWLLTYGVFLILIVSFAAAYVLPLLATLLIGTPASHRPSTWSQNSQNRQNIQNAQNPANNPTRPGAPSFTASP